MVQPQRHGQIDAHLGFLQLYHRYHVEFLIPWNLCTHKERKNSVPAIVTGTHNPNCHIVDLMSEKESLKLKIELLAYKEKILKEEVQILCCKSGSPLKIQLNSRVLGQDKGRPLLRNGIRSVGVEQSNEDEVLGTKLRASLSMQSKQSL
ncbi:adipose-secreted signaling protein isoform X2 [Bombus pascuorum]|nr:adipose-secreted signaling protein isoform X2 [Bombus pascuorum]